MVPCLLLLAGLAAAVRVSTRPAAPAATAVSGVRFDPTFRAARRASGVKKVASGFEYLVRPSTSRAEIRAMLNGLSTTGQLDSASDVLSHYLRETSSSSQEAGQQQEKERIASIVLNGCAEAGRMELSDGVLKAMVGGGVPVTSLTFCVLFKGYGRAGDLARVQRLHKAMVDRSIAFDVPTFNALLYAFARRGKMGAAESILEGMSSHGVTPSPRSFNILIRGYSQVRKRGQSSPFTTETFAPLPSSPHNARLCPPSTSPALIVPRACSCVS